MWASAGSIPSAFLAALVRMIAPCASAVTLAGSQYMCTAWGSVSPTSSVGTVSHSMNSFSASAGLDFSAAPPQALFMFANSAPATATGRIAPYTPMGAVAVSTCTATSVRSGNHSAPPELRPFAATASSATSRRTDITAATNVGS